MGSRLWFTGFPTWILVGIMRDRLKNQYVPYRLIIWDEHGQIKKKDSYKNSKFY